MFAKSIPKEATRTLPLLRFGGRIHLVDTDEGLQNALKAIGKENVLGFDTETKPTFRKGEHNRAAIVQLAAREDAYLIRIGHIGLPDGLARILEDPKITKVGISIRDDLKGLNELKKLNFQGFVDLNGVAARHFGIEQTGMRSLAGIFLGARVSKSQQTSNWESRQLTEGQLAYAATDAWVCFFIYRMLLDGGHIGSVE